MTRASYIKHNYLNISCCLNEILSIIVMFLYTSGNSKYVRIEDDIIGIEMDFIHQDIISTSAYFNFSIDVSSLLNMSKQRMYSK